MNNDPMLRPADEFVERAAHRRATALPPKIIFESTPAGDYWPKTAPINEADIPDLMAQKCAESLGECRYFVMARVMREMRLHRQPARTKHIRTKALRREARRMMG